MGTVAERREWVAEVDAEPVAALGRLARLAETWDAGWKPEGSAGGALVLPVMAGLRRGFVGGPVTIERVGGGSRVVFRPEEEDYRVDRAAFATLLLAAIGALVTVVAPFFPRLWPLVPVGILLALGAWLFIVARLRNSGPEEFFEELAEGGGE